MSAPALPAVGVPFLAQARAAVLDYWTLTKPEVNFLIVMAAATGFYLGCPVGLHFPWTRLLSTLAGALLVASGTGTLNQVIERRYDARMRRTWRRPLAAGRMRAANAAVFGIVLSVAGIAYLLYAANVLASALAAFTLTSYLFLYTPLKRKTPLCTFAGAFPGAMPPLIGWAAASGSIGSAKAWAIYALLFLWQFPHFMAIAWMYREDYARAGYRIFPVKGLERFLSWATWAPSLALFVASFSIAALNGGGFRLYAATAALGLGLLYYVDRQVLLRSGTAARQLLKATVVYLPLELLILTLGKLSKTAA